MSTEEAKRAYRQRKLLVEPVFGIIKEQLPRSFLLRGLNNVAAEWSLLATAFNLRTLWRIWRTQAPDPEFTNEAQRRIRPPKHVPDRSQLTNGAGSCDPGDRCRNDGVSNPPAHTNDAETPGHEPRTLIRQAPGYGVTSFADTTGGGRRLWCLPRPSPGYRAGTTV